jgi:hypothetical protein
MKNELKKFLDEQKESRKYSSFVWGEVLGVFVVVGYGENFNYHFNRWNESHGVCFTLNVISDSRFIIFM